MTGTSSKPSGFCFCTHTLLLSFLKEKEKDHLRSLSTALNAVLHEFRTRQFGDLPVPSERSDGDELIFISNDLLMMESSHIREHLTKSKRKPDIVATFTSKLQQAFDDPQGLSFEEWMYFNSKHEPAEPSSQKLQWTDIYQTWEMDLTTRDDSNLLHEGHPNIDQTRPTDQPTASTSSTSSRRQNGLKRHSDEAEHFPNKKARVCGHSETERRPLQVVDDHFNLLPELRCAYFATERFSADWYISHSTAVLLQGDPS